MYTARVPNPLILDCVSTSLITRTCPVSIPPGRVRAVSANLGLLFDHAISVQRYDIIL